MTSKTDEPMKSMNLPPWLRIGVALFGMAASAFGGAFVSGWTVSSRITGDEARISALEKEQGEFSAQHMAISEGLQQLSVQIDQVQRNDAMIFTILHDHWKDVPMPRDYGGFGAMPQMAERPRSSAV